MIWKSKSEMLKEFWKISIHLNLPHIYQSTPRESDLFDMPALLEYLKDSPYKEPFMEYHMEAKCPSCGVSAFDYDDDYHGWQIALTPRCPSCGAITVPDILIPHMWGGEGKCRYRLIGKKMFLPEIVDDPFLRSVFDIWNYRRDNCKYLGTFRFDFPKEASRGYMIPYFNELISVLDQKYRKRITDLSLKAEKNCLQLLTRRISTFPNTKANVLFTKRRARAGGTRLRAALRPIVGFAVTWNALASKPEISFGCRPCPCAEIMLL